MQYFSSSEKLSEFKFTFSAIKLVPALPGKQKIFDTFFDFVIDLLGLNMLKTKRKTRRKKKKTEEEKKKNSTKV